MEFLEQLNDAQRAAVEHTHGPELIVAGAGSGKTRVLTYKIAYLLRQGVNPGSILALTFTNKAAREMKDRVRRLVPSADARYLWMGTFHSICSRILRAEAERIGYTSRFTIYDTSDSKSVVRQIIKEKQLDDKIYKLNMVLSRISMAKNSLIDPDKYSNDTQIYKHDREARMYEMADVYRQYTLRLREANAMDFDDLLLNMYRLLEQDTEVRQKYQQAFEYVLIDEYQDTNYLQYLLVKLLAEPQNNICAVGDDAQSIYSFRGADIRNILSFQNGYADAKLYKLERNYRSTQMIVNAANSLIHHNEHQIFKQVYSEKEVGQRIDIRKYATDRAEGEGIVRSIQQDYALRRTEYADIAILYRTNAQSRVFENELRKQNIPYKLYGGTSFYQRKEVKDAIAYFRLAVNPKDNEALLRVINFPARKIGDTTMGKVSEKAAQLHTHLLAVAEQPIECGVAIQAATAKRLIAFSRLIHSLQEASSTLDAYTFAETVLRQSGVLEEAKKDTTAEGIDRTENLQELLSSIHEFVEQRAEEGATETLITDFLAEVSLLTDQDQNLTDQTSRVTLMTVHAAKGLEFPVIYIAGLEERLFPSDLCVRPAEIEEERRLLYVAITRAMHRCHISYAAQRFRNGTVNITTPSRFLSDIDRAYIMQEETGSLSARPRWANSSWGEDEDEHYTLPKAQATPVKRLTEVASLSKPRQPAAHAPFAAGERVRHHTFGDGTVERVYIENDNEKIAINFDEKGQKTLLLTFAKLEKL